MKNPLRTLNAQISACRKCPRLVAWREQIAKDKVKRYADWTYWGKAVPSFGPDDAQILIVGLAPAAHGANRTGRMFTGDRSGDWLYRALHKAGLSTLATSDHIDDGQQLINTRVTAVCHCAPPDNKPTPEEIKNCRPYLQTELQTMPNLKVILALGKLAFDAVLKENNVRPLAPFGHNKTVELPDGRFLVGSYHPSQQNTFTGRLTEEMLDAVFKNLNRICKK